MSDQIGSDVVVSSALADIEHHTDRVGHATSAWRRWLPSIAAALLGIAVISVVGFAPGIAHEAAHDVRHTMVFPCH